MKAICIALAAHFVAGGLVDSLNDMHKKQWTEDTLQRVEDMRTKELNAMQATKSQMAKEAWGFAGLTVPGNVLPGWGMLVGIAADIAINYKWLQHCSSCYDANMTDALDAAGEATVWQIVKGVATGTIMEQRYQALDQTYRNSQAAARQTMRDSIEKAGTNPWGGKKIWDPAYMEWRNVPSPDFYHAGAYGPSPKNIEDANAFWRGAAEDLVTKIETDGAKSAQMVEKRIAGNAGLIHEFVEGKIEGKTPLNKLIHEFVLSDREAVAAALRKDGVDRIMEEMGTLARPYTRSNLAQKIPYATEEHFIQAAQNVTKNLSNEIANDVARTAVKEGVLPQIGRTVRWAGRRITLTSAEKAASLYAEEKAAAIAAKHAGRVAEVATEMVSKQAAEKMLEKVAAEEATAKGLEAIPLINLIGAGLGAAITRKCCGDANVDMYDAHLKIVNERYDDMVRAIRQVTDIQ